MMPGITCTSCVFFSPPITTGNRAPRGQCRRHAPTMEQLQGDFPRTIWPLVLETQWCGERAEVGDAD